MSLRVAPVGAALLCAALALPAAAQEPGTGAPRAAPDAEPSGARDRTDRANDRANEGVDKEGSADEDEPRATFPTEARARLERAREAFRNVEYELLRPLLEPILEPTPQLTRRAARLEARSLLGLAYFFEAQQVRDAAAREALMDRARAQFLALLRESPDYQLDELIFPASVVELFESVRQAHAEELDAMRAAGRRSDAGLEQIFVERRVDERNWWLNFLPFGIGAFQNGDTVRGTLYAVGQSLALVADLGMFWTVERLRAETGYFRLNDDGTAAGSPFARARAWRTRMWLSLGAFGALYIGSVIDALIHYEPIEVRLRTLDAPPPELRSKLGDDAPRRRPLVGGLFLSLTWRFD